MLSRAFMPRYSEMNGAGHIGHHVLPVWLEEGFLDIFYLFEPDMRLRPPLIMASVHIDFEREMFLRKEVRVNTSVASIGNASFQLSQQVFQEEQRCASAAVKFIHFDYAMGKAKAIPQDTRAKLEALRSFN